jgi:hypothetical protein
MQQIGRPFDIFIRAIGVFRGQIAWFDAMAEKAVDDSMRLPEICGL